MSSGGDAGLDEILMDGFRLDLRIVNREVGALVEQVAADVDGGGFAGVVGVLLEGEAEDADALAVDGVEERADDFLDEAAFLPVVEMDHLAPVFGDVGQVEGLAEIDEVEDVLLETRAAEADGGLEELRADARVHADGAADFIDIGAGGFAEGGNRVDRGNPLGEEGVGDELGKLGRPEVGGEDALAGNPVGIDRDERLDGGVSFGRGFAADEDAVRAFEVLDGGAFREELGIG